MSPRLSFSRTFSARSFLTNAATLIRPAGFLAAALVLGVSVEAKAEFLLSVSFGAGLSDAQQTAVRNAADYWNTQITGYKSGVTLTGFNIQVDSVNDAQGGYLAYAGPTSITTQSGTVYTTSGSSSINLAYYGTGTTYGGANELTDVMKHEFGHVLGIGTLWTHNGLYNDGSGQYTGQYGLEGWRTEFGQTNAAFVPVEMGGGGGTADGHWNEVDGGAGPTGFVSNITGRDFEFEVMTGWANTPTFTSSVTLGTLRDLGYVIGAPTNADGDYIIEQGAVTWNMTGTRKMFKITSGTATIHTANDYSGGSFLQEGTLVLANALALGTGDVTLSGATLDIAGYAISTPRLILKSGSIADSGTVKGKITANTSIEVQSGNVSAALAGAGALTKTTSGTVTLTSANTYAGGTDVQAGRLVVRNAGALSTGTVRVSGGTLDITDTAVTGIGAFTLQSGTITGTTGSLNASAFDLQSGTVSAKLAGAGAVTKSTAGTVTLSVANTYTGGTTITDGVLVAAHTQALSTGAVTVSGGTLEIAANVTTGAVVLNSGTIAGTTGDLAASSLEARSGTISAKLAGSGALTKTTSGTVILSGTNTYTGGTTVTAGTLVAAGTAALGTGDVNLDGGNLRISNGSALEKTTLNLNGGALSFDGITTAQIKRLAGAGGIDLQNTSGAAVILTLTESGTDSTYGGVISGSGSLVKSGTNTLTLTGISGYTGGTTVESGVLEVGNASALGLGPITVSGGTLDTGAIQMSVNAAITLKSGTIIGTTGSLSGSSFDMQAGTVSAELAGGGALTKTTDGTVTLNSANTYAGGTNVQAGRLVVKNAGALSTGTVRVSGGTLDIVGTAVTGIGAFTLESGTITGSTGNLNASAFDLQSGTVSAKLAGAGAVTKSTAGTVTLSAANAYTGGTTVTDGTLVAANAQSLSTGPVTVSGGTLEIAANVATGSVVLNSGTIAATKGYLAASSLEARSGTISAKLAGSGALTKTTTGTVILSGTNTYTGGTTVTDGTLVAAGTAALGTGDVNLNGGSLRISHGSALEKTTLNLNGGALSFDGITAAQIKRLAGAGGIDLINTSGAAVTLTLADNGANSTYGGVISGSGSLVKSGTNTLTLTGISGYTGGTTVEGGVLEVGNASAIGLGPITVSGGTLDTGAIQMSVDAAITLKSGTIKATTGSLSGSSFEVQAGTVSAKLAGAGALTKTTDGTVTLNSANTYVGGTDVRAGRLVVKNAGALSTGTVRVSGGTLDIADTVVAGIGAFTLQSGTITGSTGNLNVSALDLQSGTVSVKLAGSGAVTKSTAGTVTLSVANTYTGGTTITDGVLVAAHTQALSTGAVTVSGGTLEIAANVTTGSVVLNSGTIAGTTGDLAASSLEARSGTISAKLAGSGALTKTTSGTVILSGTNTYMGGTTVTDGTLVAANAQSLSTGPVTVSGGTLEIAANVTAGAVVLNSGTIAGTTGHLAASSLEARSGTISAALAGSVALTKTTSGTVTLSGANTYTGGTTVTDGILVAAGPTALGTGNVNLDGGNLRVANGSVLEKTTLNLNGGALSFAGITAAKIKRLAGTGSVDLQNTSGAAVTLTLADSGANSTYAGSFSGSGSLVKSGTNTLTLTGASGHTGGTTVSAGRLVVSNSAALGSGPVKVVGGMLNIDSAVEGVGTFVLESGTLAGTATFAANNYELKSGLVSARLQGSGAVTKTTGGTVTISSASTHSGGTTVEAGKLILSNSEGLGTGATLVKTGGTLQFADGASFESESSGANITLNGGKLEFARRADLRMTGAVTGTGDLVQNGTGVITLTDAAYTGNTIVNAGRLVLSAGALPGGAITVGAAGALEIAGDGEVHDFSVPTSGAGSIAYTGSGTTRVHGTQAQTGSLTVGSGHTLSLGSSSAETVSISASLLAIDAGATLRGSGYLAGSLRNAGRVSPGFSPGTLVVDGDFTNTGTLDMEISTSGAHDEILYSGQAHLGGTLNVIYLDGTPAKGTRIRLLADTDTTDGLPSVTGSFDAMNISADTGVLFNTGDSIEFLVGGTLVDIPGFNLSKRLLPLARAITEAAKTNSGINTLASPVTILDSALGRVLQGASPLGLAALAELPVAEASRDVDELRRHLDARRFERAEAATALAWSPYVSGNGLKVVSGKDDDSPVFDYHTIGGMVGADKGVTPELTVGLQASYDSGRADFHDGAGKVTQDHARVCIYGSRMFDARYYVDAGAFGGVSSFETTRRTVMGNEQASPSGWDTGVFATVGTIVPISPVFSLAPHAGLLYTHAATDGFTEKGDDIALRVSKFAYDSLEVRVGATLNWKIALGEMPLRVGIDASLVHELLDNELGINADFAATPTGGFTTDAVVRPSDKLAVGPELDLQVAEGKSITASYKFEYAFGNATGHRFDVGYRTRF